MAKVDVRLEESPIGVRSVVVRDNDGKIVQVGFIKWLDPQSADAKAILAKTDPVVSV